METHRPEVCIDLMRRPGTPDTRPVYTAECSCGWIGPTRSSRSRANIDATAHKVGEACQVLEDRRVP